MVAGLYLNQQFPAAYRITGPMFAAGVVSLCG
jgi:hypothetical protein